MKGVYELDMEAVEAEVCKACPLIKRTWSGCNSKGEQISPEEFSCPCIDGVELELSGVEIRCKCRVESERV